jgi:hypothetical protein
MVRGISLSGGFGLERLSHQAVAITTVGGQT